RIEEPSRVVVAKSLGVKELEELADGGGFAGLRAGREVAITHVRDPLATAGRLRGSQATDVGEEIVGVLQITAVGEERIVARATLGSHHFQKRFDPRRRTAHCNCSIGTSKMVSTRFGSTKV